MGPYFSRRNGGTEDLEINSSNAYRYPPKAGCYFGTHYIMGGNKFETTQPESYLFGENSDLNFLGNRPAQFPYPTPQAHEPTKTLKSLVNIRRDSIRLIKVTEKDKDNGDTNEPNPPNNKESDTPEHRYNIEFIFDSDVPIAITIYYLAKEEITNSQVIYHSRDPQLVSQTFLYGRGTQQTFSQPSHVIEPDNYPEQEWLYNPDKDNMPVVIQCVVRDDQISPHSHASFATIEKSADGGYSLKALKQKQMAEGLYFLLQEIYGIENKSPERQKLEEEFDDNGSECVICMCQTRDTLILPCRHLCLCILCADNLRYQANNCPICRAPFRALLQIRAMKKKVANTTPSPQQPPNDDSTPLSQDSVPPGYEALPLIEALNGPQTQTNSQPFVQSIPSAVPHESSGTSPNLKRKDRRSSGRSHRRNTNRDDNKQTHPPPVQVTTDGATAMLPLTVLQPSKKDAATDAAASPATNKKSRSKLASKACDADSVPATRNEHVTDAGGDMQPGADDVANPRDVTLEMSLAPEAQDDDVDDDTGSTTNAERTPLCRSDDNDVTIALNTFSSALGVAADDDDDAQVASDDKILGMLDSEETTTTKGGADSSASSYSSTSSAKALLEAGVAAAVGSKVKAEP